MNILLLNGHGINLKVDNAKLIIQDGRYTTKEEPMIYTFLPKRIDVNQIVIYGNSGNITLDAIKWLIKHNVQISIMDWNGKLLTTMLPPESSEVKTKFAQYSAYNEEEQRLHLARRFIEAKFSRTQMILDWLQERYPDVDTNIQSEAIQLRKAKTIPEIMMTEGRVAAFYWQQFNKIIPEKHEFRTREYQKRPRGAGDAVNCLLNYGYAILEAECLRAINTAGLDAHIGFLHEKRMGKNSLAYDLQEPFRFLVDLAVIALIERDEMQKSDFIRSETYTLRLRPSGARKLVAEINNQLDRKVGFNSQQWSWRYVIQAKTRELAQFLVGKRTNIDLSGPNEPLERFDSEDLRQKILQISYTEWAKMGFSKGTLHYMKRNARQNKPFSLNKHVRERLEALPEAVLTPTD